MDVSTLERWTVEQSVELYAIRNWGSGYFDVSPAGDVVVRLPRGGNHGEVSEVRLMDIVEGLKARGMMLPVVLRFADILGDRIRQINESFARAAQGIGYRGGYRGVYPIKVNQQQQVVEEVARQGRRWHHGLEAGSKAELIAALAYLQDPEAYLVCNGYKDEEFIRLALNAQKMGLRPILVLEMPGELELIRRVSESMNVRPAMGVRVKLASRAGGRWTESGGDRSVFGLNTAQVMDVVEELRKHGMLDCLQMLHYHLGSQIPNIDHIRQAIAEAARLYVELVREGAAMGILDIGGGLAVDYDGSHTNFPSSSNYDLFEYCSDVLEGIMRVADSAGVPHPTVISESGRALVAYHSVLLFQVLDTARLSSHPPPTAIPADAPEALRNLKELADQPLTAKNLQECYHDAVFYRDELRNGFLHGVVRLRDRAIGEQIFWHLADRVVREARSLKYVPEEIQKLEVALADIYYANFSVFQSLPDSWAIGQLFPIIPIHRLDERPSRLAIFSDITCDCDGKIDRFIDLHDVKEALPVHPFRPNEDYIFGVFLVGAYQETLGDLHNLFGDTNVVTVAASPEGNGFELVHEIHGDSVADVLSYVEYDPKEMIERVRELAENAVRTGRITAEERRIILDDYGAGLRGYTYYET